MERVKHCAEFVELVKEYETGGMLGGGGDEDETLGDLHSAMKAERLRRLLSGETDSDDDDDDDADNSDESAVSSMEHTAKKKSLVSMRLPTVPPYSA